LNFIGMVLLFLSVVMGITFIVRGARGYGGRGGPWDCDRPQRPASRSTATARPMVEVRWPVADRGILAAMIRARPYPVTSSE
jgi:hypothetical protein